MFPQSPAPLEHEHVQQLLKRHQGMIRPGVAHGSSGLLRLHLIRTKFQRRIARRDTSRGQGMTTAAVSRARQWPRKLCDIANKPASQDSTAGREPSRVAKDESYPSGIFERHHYCSKSGATSPLTSKAATKTKIQRRLVHHGSCTTACPERHGE